MNSLQPILLDSIKKTGKKPLKREFTNSENHDAIMRANSVRNPPISLVVPLQKSVGE